MRLMLPSGNGRQPALSAAIGTDIPKQNFPHGRMLFFVSPDSMMQGPCKTWPF